MSHPETVHGLVCIGKSGNKIRDEYLYKLVCPYCETLFEATHTQVKSKTGRKLGRNKGGGKEGNSLTYEANKVRYYISRI